jgi:hypothetical protein
MKILALTIVLAANIPGFAQHDHTEQMNDRAAHVMGFSQEATTHHFSLSFDGGSIEVLTNDIKDTASRDEIRTHFRHVSRMFANGDFTDPMLVHAVSVPGTTEMKQQKNSLHWREIETPRGAKMIVTADNKSALEALHQFLRFQIEDHKTGDCEIPH